MAKSGNITNLINSNAVNKDESRKLAEAKLLMGKNNTQNAIFILKVLIDSNPNVHEAFYLLGCCFRHEGDNLAAISYFKCAIELCSTVSEYYSEMAAAYATVGSSKRSIDNYNRALDIDESNISALGGLGHVYYVQGDLVSSKKYFSKSVALKPSLGSSHIMLAYVLSKLDDYEQALIHAKKAEKLATNDASIICTLGKIYLIGGKTEDAIKSFRRAIEKDRLNGFAYYDLVLAKKIHDKDDPIIKSMEQNLTKSMPSINRQIMHFALGQAYNDSKQWDKAFDHFNKGNRLIPESYNKLREIIFNKDIKKIFTPAFFKRFENVGHQSTEPVFIVGMPRSGSTLIDQVLSSHSNVYSIGESKSLSEIVTENIADSEFKIRYPHCLKKLPNEFFETVANQYVDFIKKDSGSTSCIVNKMLYNFVYLGLIAIVLPKAKIIHSMRNPLDTCLSNYFISFEPGETEDEMNSSLENLGHYYTIYYELMEHWKKVLPIKILDVHYEDMVSDFEQQARNIVNYCSLEWQESCLEFYKAKRSVQTASLTQVRQPIYSSSVSRWPPYAKHLGPLVEQLGDLVKDDYAQLRELGCEFKVKKQGLLKRFFSL